MMRVSSHLQRYRYATVFVFACVALFSGHYSDAADVNQLASVAERSATPTGRADAEVFVQSGHSAPVARITVSPDARFMATASHDGTLKLWDINARRLIYTYREHRSLVNAVAFTPDGKFLVTAVAHPESALHVIDRATGRQVRKLTEHVRGPQDIAILPGGRQVVSISDFDKSISDPPGAEVILWDLATGDLVAKWIIAGGYRSIAVLPDGQHAVIGSYQGEMMLISLVDGRVVRQYARQETNFNGKVFHLPIEQIIAHPDGHTFFTAHGGTIGSAIGGGAVFQWAVEDTQLRRKFEGPTGTVWGIALSADARSLIAGGGDTVISSFVSTSVINNAVWIWGIESGALQARWQITEKPAPGQGIRAVAVTPAGQVIYANANDHALTIRPLIGEGEAFSLSGRQFAKRILAVSPRGDSVWTASSIHNYFRGPRRVSKWSHPKVSSMPPWPVLGEYRIMRWDLQTGLREDVVDDHEGQINLLAFAGGGGPYSLSSPPLAQSEITEIETVAGAESKITRSAVEGAELAHMQEAIAFSPSGRLLAISYMGTFGRKELSLKLDESYFIAILERSANGLILRHVLPATNQVTALAFTRDESGLLAGICEIQGNTCDRKGGVRLHRADLSTGKWVAKSESTTESITRISVSPDGKHALATGVHALMLDVDGMQLIRSLADDRVAISAAWSSDQKQIAIAMVDQRIHILNAETFMAQHSQDAKTVGRGRIGVQVGLVTEVFAVESGMGKRQGVLVTSVENGGPADKAGLEAGDAILTFDGQTINSIEDLLRVVGGTRPNTKSVVRVWRTQSARELDITVAEQSRDRQSAVASRAGILRTISGFDGYINDLSFSPDGKSLLALGNDGALRVWDVATGALRVTMIEFDDGEWITVTPEGYFAGSQNADHQLNVRYGDRVYGMDQFYDVFYRPDIVQRKMRGERIDDLISLTIADALQRPPPQVGVSIVSSNEMEGVARIRVRARDAGGGVGNVRIFHNGKLIASDEDQQKISSAQPKQIRPAEQNSRGVRAMLAANAHRTRASGKSSADREITVRLAPGQNRVWATGFNADNSLQARPTAIDLPQQPDVPPRVFVLAIGVNRYKAEKDIPRLTYAVKDAQMFSAELHSRMKALFPQQPIDVTLLADREASLEVVEKHLELLAKKMKPGDVFVWFIASHGMLDGNGVYTVVLHDANLDSPGVGVLPNTKILGWLKRLPVLNQLLVLDTCHAGGMEDAVRGIYDARIGVLARSMGLHILASASSTEEAVDGYKGNGLFTHAMLRSIVDPASDTNGDKKLSVTELGRSSRNMTQRISRQLRMNQTPMVFHFGRDLNVSEFR